MCHNKYDFKVNTKYYCGDKIFMLLNSILEKNISLHLILKYGLKVLGGGEILSWSKQYWYHEI